MLTVHGKEHLSVLLCCHHGLLLTQAHLCFVVLSCCCLSITSSKPSPWVVCWAAVLSDVGVVCVFEHPVVMDSVQQGVVGFGQVSVCLWVLLTTA